jgi:alanine dehydrogenase
LALTNVTLPYVLKLANQGWEKACKNDESLSKGLNVVKGKIVYEEIAEAFNWSVDAMA